MCAYSAVSDYGFRIPQDSWSTPDWFQYQELLRKAAEFDKLTNQPHCEDPAKQVWMKAVEDRLNKLESGKE